MMDDLSIELVTISDAGLVVSLTAYGDKLADLEIKEVTQLIDWLTIWRDDMREARRQWIGPS